MKQDNLNNLYEPRLRRFPRYEATTGLDSVLARIYFTTASGDRSRDARQHNYARRAKGVNGRIYSQNSQMAAGSPQELEFLHTIHNGVV